MAIMLKTQLNEQYTREHIVKKKVFFASLSQLLLKLVVRRNHPPHTATL